MFQDVIIKVLTEFEYMKKRQDQVQSFNFTLFLNSTYAKVINFLKYSWGMFYQVEPLALTVQDHKRVSYDYARGHFQKTGSF